MKTPYEIRETDDLHSPSLVVFRSILRENLDAMIRIAGSPDRLRPHVKTHKMPAIVRLVESLGISRHKCATIAEAEMVARAGGSDVLIAYPLVGPNVRRMALLIQRYPNTSFRATVESASAALALSEAVIAAAVSPLPVLVDLDVGMGRTGIDVNQAADLYRRIPRLHGLIADGLHAYDGHIRDTDLEIRRGKARIVADTVLQACETSSSAKDSRWIAWSWAAPPRSRSMRRWSSLASSFPPGPRRSTTTDMPAASRTCRSGPPPGC